MERDAKPDTLTGSPARVQYSAHTDEALRDLPVEWVPTAWLHPGHDLLPGMRAVVGAVALVMERTHMFGPPLVVERATWRVLVGVLRLAAAQRLGLAEVPVVSVSRQLPPGAGLGMASA